MMTDPPRAIRSAKNAEGNTGIMERSGDNTSRAAAKMAGANAPASTPKNKGRECCKFFIWS